MRAFWAALAVSLVLGVAGLISLVTAIREYTSTMETYTELAIRYEPGSFTWTAPDFSAATTRIVITNDSPADATIENLNIFLRFDGEFAGTNYDRFSPLDVPRGEARTVELQLLVTTGTIRPQGGTARLAFDGSASVRFEGIERDISLNVRQRIGVVPAEES